MKIPLFKFTSAPLLAVFFVASAFGQTTVQDAWVRGTVAQQKSSGAFMRITSAQGGRLVSVQSPVAGAVDIHEMTMSGDVMQMRAIGGVDLPAGKAVEFKPGGYHLMLLDLKQALKAGDSVPLTLVVEGSDKKRETLEIKAPVRPLNAPAAMHGDGTTHKH